MLTSSDNLKNIYKNETTVKTALGCTLELNMNSIIDGITVTSATSDSTYISKITDWPAGTANPFKKLFPVDSIVKPFRPVYSGAKYYVMSSTDTASYTPYRTVDYFGSSRSDSKARVYYPGVSVNYKYWIGAKDTNIDLTVQYKQTSTTWSNAGKTGDIPAGNKEALANKIIVKFEKFHALPSAYTVVITKSDNSTVTVVNAGTPPTSGYAYIYLSGGSWTAVDGAEVNQNTLSFDTPLSIKSIRVTATNPGGGKYIGVIEISARWIKDISSDIASFSVKKESSSSSEDILPVGKVTSNSLQIGLAKYDQSALQIIEYNRESTSFDSSLIYMTKNAEIVPYIKTYHENGALGSTGSKYDITPHGVYYADSFTIDEHGYTRVTGLDSTKYLMDTLCPDLLCEKFPVTAILRNLLDSVGFTNYKFNLKANDTSVPQIIYWWTDNRTTVWEAIQALCRDIQMNAVMDEYNVLQFYSRDYLYDKDGRSSVWTFTYDQDGDTLPNIADFAKKDIASANSVQVLWHTPIVSNYTQSSSDLWTSPVNYLSAGSLKNAIELNSTEFVIDIFSLDAYSSQLQFFNYAGYILVDSEIIEYDGIGYDIVLLDGTVTHQFLKSMADANKYLALSRPGFSNPDDPIGSSYFKPSGRYLIKTRGALGTTAVKHDPAVYKLDGWYGRTVSWT